MIALLLPKKKLSFSVSSSSLSPVGVGLSFRPGRKQPTTSGFEIRLAAAATARKGLAAFGEELSVPWATGCALGADRIFSRLGSFEHVYLPAPRGALQLYCTDSRALGTVPDRKKEKVVRTCSKISTW